MSRTPNSRKSSGHRRAGVPLPQAGIIDILFKRTYLKKQRKQVVSTALGREMFDTSRSPCRIWPAGRCSWRGLRKGGRSGVFLAGVTDGVRKLTASANTQGISRSHDSTGTARQQHQRPAGRSDLPCPGNL